jgi:hypothetical protein
MQINLVSDRFLQGTLVVIRTAITSYIMFAHIPGKYLVPLIGLTIGTIEVIGARG